MARNTKPLSGGGKDKFLRQVVQSVDGLTDAARRDVTKALSESISEVRARREAYERLRSEAGASVSEAQITRVVHAAPEPTSHSAAAVEAPMSAPAAAFDPYAFSVVAILTRKGRSELVAALEGITSVEHLRQLADAQHLSLDPNLGTAADMRAAIVTGAERRIAERKAAAS